MRAVWTQLSLHGHPDDIAAAYQRAMAFTAGLRGGGLPGYWQRGVGWGAVVGCGGGVWRVRNNPSQVANRPVAYLEG